MSDDSGNPGDSYTETETKSWGSRIQESLSGLVFGVVLAGGTILGLFWNEGRAVTTTRSLDEGAGLVVAANAARVDPANSGKFVHVTGDLKTAQPLVDDMFGVSAAAIRMERKVEMYQWHEDKETETNSNFGGSQTKSTRYTYERKWSSRRIDSSRFKQSATHTNPPMRFQSRAFTADDASLGAFSPGRVALEKLPTTTPWPVPSLLAADLKGRHGGDAQINDGMIYLGTDPANPRIGDVRITFRIMVPGPASFMGQQSGTALMPYATQSGDRLLLVKPGIMSADQMFQSAHTANAIFTWLLRTVCVLLMWLGFYLLLRPIVVLADVVPLLGSIIGAGGALIALILTLVIAPITIAVAWFWYRPLVSLAILAAGLTLAYWVRSRNATSAPTPTPSAPRGHEPTPKASFLSQPQRLPQVNRPVALPAVQRQASVRPVASMRPVAMPAPRSAVPRTRGSIVQPRQSFGKR
jgi:hypothetical protein